MMHGDSTDLFSKPWERMNTVHTWAQMIICHPAEYANKMPIWVNKVNLYTFTHATASNEYFIKGMDAFG